MKYFYTDPLKAAWMSEKHGVSFIYPDEDKKRGCIDSLRIEASISIRIEASISIYGDYKLKYHLPHPLKTSFKRFIHPDCHELLKPQVGDFVEETNGETCWALTVPSGGDEIINSFWHQYKVHKTAKIIQRNGKAFFMPEVEE